MLFAFLLHPQPAFSAPGDDLIVTGSIVNLREKASTDSRILLKLKRDEILIEVKREGDWVEVFTDRSDVSSGWMHNTLVVPLTTRNTVAVTNHSESFIRFMETFSKLNESWQQQNGYLPFTNAEEFSNRKIRLTANAEWLKVYHAHREQMLSLIFDQWSNAVGPELSIDIEVVDQNGERHMTMFR